VMEPAPAPVMEPAPAPVMEAAPAPVMEAAPTPALSSEQEVAPPLTSTPSSNSVSPVAQDESEQEGELIPLFGHQPRRVTSPDIPRQPAPSEETMVEEAIPAPVEPPQVTGADESGSEVSEETSVREPVSLNPENLQAFFSWLLAEDAPLAGELAQAKLGVGNGAVTIAFRSELFAGRFREGEEQHRTLKTKVQEFFGGAVNVMVVKASAELETQFEQTEREDEEKRQQRRDAAKEHPAVQKMASAFGGEIRGVRLAEEGNHE